ncbi:hypothetical protein OXPF_01470 [Oxobacter pfennigii]|uniref:Uncharacterized protein n=1 Tax=Oxobacter pfennigii TaxID=36849 RepID=A0A0P8WBY5_9CLOT|nr:hypothetical protein [Oxobacter pfennigii]KPU46228.1 hypothetical protein OXPF_01470 [Oxobacter pfennigii]
MYPYFYPSYFGKSQASDNKYGDDLSVQRPQDLNLPPIAGNTAGMPVESVPHAPTTMFSMPPIITQTAQPGQHQSPVDFIQQAQQQMGQSPVDFIQQGQQTQPPPQVNIPPQVQQVPDFFQTDETPVMDPQFTQGFLRTQIGKKVKVEFLIGTNTTTDRIGTLVGVGISYILIRLAETDDILLADMYSIKFVTFYL